MPLNPALKTELEQRKTDLQRRISAMQAWHDNFSVPDTDPPTGLVNGLSAVAAELQQLTGEVQGFSVPDTDPPTGAVFSLQQFEIRLHTVENQLLNLAS